MYNRERKSILLSIRVKQNLFINIVFKLAVWYSIHWEPLSETGKVVMVTLTMVTS